MRRYSAICPKEGCLGLVNAGDNWKEGQICIMGICSKCGQDYLEDELDWIEDKEAEAR